MTQTVAIYARYSSDQQRDASIEDQVRVCRVRAEREGGTAEHEIRQAEPGEPAQPLPPLSADIAAIYRHGIHNLAQGLAGKDATECRERVRKLIDQVIIHPAEDDGDPRYEFVGDLAAMLTPGGIASAKGEPNAIHPSNKHANPFG